MLSVLEDAIACFQKYIFARDGKGKMLFQEAEEWVQERGGDWLFSFANVCETLGFDPEYLRQGIKSQRFTHRSEEHTSELQSRENLVCRLLLEKKKKKKTITEK